MAKSHDGLKANALTQRAPRRLDNNPTMENKTIESLPGSFLIGQGSSLNQGGDVQKGVSEAVTSHFS